jgi:hypothetical protein
MDEWPHRVDAQRMRNWQMKTMINGAMAIVIGSVATPLAARDRQQDKRTRYEYNGQYFNSYAECRATKEKAKKDGAIVGAAAAGVGAAILGANLGEAALIAGGGALVGNQIGKSKKC